jgi:ABC-type antimicrobial peptide transport system permease subunit
MYNQHIFVAVVGFFLAIGLFFFFFAACALKMIVVGGARPGQQTLRKTVWRMSSTKPRKLEHQIPLL